MQNGQTFEEACGPYSALVYRHCLQMLGNPHDAEDAAQETMLKAYRAFSRFDGKAPGGWLFRIAHNLCLDRLGTSSSRHETPILQPMLEQGFDPEDSSPNPEDRAMLEEKRQKLNEAIQKLPVAQQTLLALRFGEGLSYEEIARCEGLRLGTVKSGISRAKEALMKLLPEDLFP